MRKDMIERRKRLAGLIQGEINRSKVSIAILQEKFKREQKWPAGEVIEQLGHLLRRKRLLCVLRRVRKCPNCAGSGGWMFSADLDEYEPRWVKCSKCAGSGRLI